MNNTQLDTMDRMLVEQVVANEAPSVVVAYLLAIFLGFLSAHRFYLGRPGTAILQILSLFTVIIGLIWWVIDLFLIPGMVEQARGRVRARETAHILASKPPLTIEPAPPPPSVTADLVASVLRERPAP